MKTMNPYIEIEKNLQLGVELMKQHTITEDGWHLAKSKQHLKLVRELCEEHMSRNAYCHETQIKCQEYIIRSYEVWNEETLS